MQHNNFEWANRLQRSTGMKGRLATTELEPTIFPVVILDDLRASLDPDAGPRTFAANTTFNSTAAVLGFGYLLNPAGSGVIIRVLRIDATHDAAQRHVIRKGFAGTNPTGGTTLGTVQLSPGGNAVSPTGSGIVRQGQNALGSNANLPFWWVQVPQALDRQVFTFQNLSLDPGEWVSVEGTLLLAAAGQACFEWDEIPALRG